MTPPSSEGWTPRAAGSGASAHPAWARRARSVLVACAALCGAAAPGAGQIPDSLAVPDSLARLDSVVVVATPPPVADTAAVPDSMGVFHRIPDIGGGPPAGFATGVWVFEREDILGSRAVTLAELVGTLPGILPLRGGDFGTPRTVTAFGLAGGGVRVLWDGMEMVPLDGGVTDLSRVGLGGVERVRVERHGDEVRVELTSLRNVDPRPYTLVEAGTGDLSTNLFRGTFVHPRALGGSLGLSLDRIDTRGSRGAETGTQQGLWLRYTRHGGDRWAVTGEVRRMKVESEVPIYPVTSTRTDWVVRARTRLRDDLVVEAFTGESDLEADAADGALVRRDGRQHGVHAAWTPGAVWARGAFRSLGSGDVPSSTAELSAGGELAPLGGASGALSRESWGGEGATLVRFQARTAPVFGLSGFAGFSSGTRGARMDSLALPLTPPAVAPDAEPFHALTDRTALRLGAAWRWRGAEVAGAWLSLDTDSLRPLGTPLDRDGLVLPGVERRGWEVAGRVPLPLGPDGFALTGSLQQWDEGARYLPRRQYHGALDFHDVFLPTENLEVWGGLGVDGRDPMIVPLAAVAQPDDDPATPLVPATVPFYQSWYAFLQVRVVTVRIFIRWENFTLRPANQDFPERLLPRTRALYGVRWTLWN